MGSLYSIENSEQANTILNSKYHNIVGGLPDESHTNDYGLGPYSDLDVFYYNLYRDQIMVRRNGKYPPSIILGSECLQKCELPYSSIEIDKEELEDKNIRIVAYSQTYWAANNLLGIDFGVNFKIGNMGRYNPYRGFERLEDMVVAIEDTSNGYLSTDVLQIPHGSSQHIPLRNGNILHIQYNEEYDNYEISIHSTDTNGYSVFLSEVIEKLSDEEFTQCAYELAEFFNRTSSVLA